MNTSKSRRIGMCLAFILVFSGSWAASPVLKFRILLDDLTPPERDSGNLDIRILNDASAGSASSKVSESSATMDEIRQVLSASDYIRVIDSDGNPSDANLLLRYRVDYDGPAPIVYLSLYNPENMAVIQAVSAQASSTEAAVQRILPELENALIERDWTVRVKGVSEGRILVPRGENDGLRVGTILMGYPSTGEGEAMNSDELLLLADGSGHEYSVTRLRDEAALIEPVGDAPPLNNGDLLEYRGVDLRKRTDPNRDRDVWNNLYNKN